METFLPENFFDLSDFRHQSLFHGNHPVWHALGDVLEDYLDRWDDWEVHSALPTATHVLDGPISVGRDCRIEPGAVLRGPLIVGDGCEIRTGAYLRGGVILGRGCVVGAHSEIKRAILLDHAHAPHQNYVGDSVLGQRVNLGAGTILSNVKNIGREVTFRFGDHIVRTGLRKFGAVLGDDCRTGCNTVLNPGVLMAPCCVTYPNVSLRSGYYPRSTLIKLRQSQQQTVLDRLDGT